MVDSVVPQKQPADGDARGARSGQGARSGPVTTDRPLSSPPGPPVPLGEMKVAVVGDEPVLGLVNDVLCRLEIAKVSHDRDRPGVREPASWEDTDLLVLDLGLPEPSGFSILENLTARASEDDYFPVLAIAADDDAATRKRALAAGAQDLLVLPVAPWKLELRIRNLLVARYYNQKMRRQYERLETLLELQRQTLSAPIDEVYQLVLEAAVRTVPGADAGTVLINRGDEFVFRAAVGYELAELAKVSFTPADMRSWHGGGPKEWRQARPRIVRHDEADLLDIATATELPAALEGHGRLDEIRANLYFPVVYREEVLAILNLDSFRDSAAFTQASIDAVSIFGPPVASLLHEAHHLEELRQASLTDPLTGLRNRRGFDVAMQAERARVDRHGGAFGVLLMDLNGFKKVNDRLGHAAGDELLVELAAALDKNRRQEDVVARWGGDEFAVVLPWVTKARAADAARRYVELVSGIRREGVQLGATVGVSLCPDDGRAQDILLRIADRRLYEARAAGVPFLPGLE